MNENFFSAQQQVQTFEKMHLKLRQPIEEFLFYQTGTTQDWEDLAQEVFIKLWMNWGRLEAMNEDELKDYVFIIIRNHLINERKSNNRPKRDRMKFIIEYSNTHSRHYYHDDVIVWEGLHLHRLAVQQLPKKIRILYQHHSYGYTVGEIAKMFNRSKCTVNNQLVIAYKAVKENLIKYYGREIVTGRKDSWKIASMN